MHDVISDYSWIGVPELETQCIREASKWHRRELTDAVQGYVGFAKSRGSENADHYYKSVTRTANEALTQVRPTWSVERDDLSPDDLRLLAYVEQCMARAIRRGIALCRGTDADYHIPFEMAKVAAYCAAGADPSLMPPSRHARKRDKKAA